MKIRIYLLPLFLLTQLVSFSQQVRKLALEIKSSVSSEGYNGEVFLKTEDGICQSAESKDGFVDLYFFDYLSKDAFLAIQQDRGGILNVSLGCLLNAESVITTPCLTIKVKENKIETRDDLDFLITLLPNRQIEHKVKPDFSPDWQKRETGKVFWYYPTKTLLDTDFYNHLVRDTAYLNGFYTEYGYYPNDRDLDKIALSMATKSAEFVGGWYSWNLLQLKEPILFNGTDSDTYRFTWIGNTYFHEYDPYSVRIEKMNDGSAMVYCSYKNNSRESGSGSSSLYCDIFPMDKETFCKFLNLVNINEFLKKSSLVNQEGEKDDSETRIFEICKNGQYHVVYRYKGEDTDMDELQKFLWNLTGLGENKIVHRRQRIE